MATTDNIDNPTNRKNIFDTTLQGTGVDWFHNFIQDDLLALEGRDFGTTILEMILQDQIRWWNYIQINHS